MNKIGFSKFICGTLIGITLFGYSAYAYSISVTIVKDLSDNDPGGCYSQLCLDADEAASQAGGFCRLIGQYRDSKGNCTATEAKCVCVYPGTGSGTAAGFSDRGHDALSFLGLEK